MPKPTSKSDLNRFRFMLNSKKPFTFVRFSDGEMEIIRNETLIIKDKRIEWRKGNFESTLPEYDSKTFMPSLHQSFRVALIASAQFHAETYFKGVPTRHNRMISDRDLMTALNGGTSRNLTFADLFLNANYKYFIHKIMPIFDTFKSVTVVGNFRMQPKLHNSIWNHIAIPDDFIPIFADVQSDSLQKIKGLEQGSLVLCSASSLTNVLGCNLVQSRPDLTVLDIGTSMHGLMGLDSTIRSYQIEMQPWNFSNAKAKLRYKLSRGYRPRW